MLESPRRLATYLAATYVTGAVIVLTLSAVAWLTWQRADLALADDLPAPKAIATPPAADPSRIEGHEMCLDFIIAETIDREWRLARVFQGQHADFGSPLNLTFCDVYRHGHVPRKRWQGINGTGANRGNGVERSNRDPPAPFTLLPPVQVL